MGSIIAVIILLGSIGLFVGSWVVLVVRSKRRRALAKPTPKSPKEIVADIRRQQHEEWDREFSRLAGRSYRKPDRAEIIRIQTLAQDVGYWDGPVDGNLGASLTRAVRRMQRDPELWHDKEEVRTMDGRLATVIYHPDDPRGWYRLFP